MLRLVADNTATGGGDAGERRKLIAKVHVAKKQLGMLDDDYRALVQRAAGVASAKDCTNAQLLAVVAEFVRLGFKGAASQAPRRAQTLGPVAKKARAMWISLGQLGAIDDPSDAALEAFARRQLHVDRMQWMDEREGYKLIEALKAIAQRHGWDQHVIGRMSPAARLRAIKNNLVSALVSKLLQSGDTVAAGCVTYDRGGWTADELDETTRILAARLRAIRKAAAKS